MHQRIIEELEHWGGVVARRHVPGLAPQLDWALRVGDLTRVLRGVYARPSNAELVVTRARAAALADPDAIVCGQAAAVLHGWLPECSQPVDLVTNVLNPNDWLRVRHRTVPPKLTRRFQHVRCTSRALTAVDLIPELGPGIVDEALRRRVSLAELNEALTLTPNRRGNALRRRVLADSKQSPWSAAERAAHQALRAAKIGGWQANVPVFANQYDPAIAWLDIAFRALRLGIEIDGAEHHATMSSFVGDRERDERLALMGWQVVRFTAKRVLDDPASFAVSVAGLLGVRKRRP